MHNTVTLKPTSKVNECIAIDESLKGTITCYKYIYIKCPRLNTAFKSRAIFLNYFNGA